MRNTNAAYFAFYEDPNVKFSVRAYWTSCNDRMRIGWRDGH